MRGTRRGLIATALPLLFVAACASGVSTPPTPAATPTPPPAPAHSFHVATDGVAANLYLPPDTAGRRSRAVLFFGGSEGGISDPWLAVALAGRGFVVLELGYFEVPDEPRLPGALAHVPLEYFAAAARLLAAQPEVDPAHIAVWGGSRGSEAAALLAGDYPDLVHGAVLSSPSSVVNPGFPDPRQPAWTWHGMPLPSIRSVESFDPDPPDAPAALLPVEKIAGPIVTICGVRDSVWPSCNYAAVIARRAGAERVTALSYPDAGHAPVEFGAELAAGRAVANLYGGTPEATIAAEHDALPRITAALDAS